MFKISWPSINRTSMTESSIFANKVHLSFQKCLFQIYLYPSKMSLKADLKVNFVNVSLLFSQKFSQKFCVWINQLNFKSWFLNQFLLSLITRSRRKSLKSCLSKTSLQLSESQTSFTSLPEVSATLEINSCVFLWEKGEK